MFDRWFAAVKTKAGAEDEDDDNDAQDQVERKKWVQLFDLQKRSRGTKGLTHSKTQWAGLA